MTEVRMTPKSLERLGAEAYRSGKTVDENPFIGEAAKHWKHGYITEKEFWEKQG